MWESKLHAHGGISKEQLVTDTFPPWFLGCFYHGPCYDFMQQHPLDSTSNMIIPRASTNSAASSGSSTPTIPAENGNTAYTHNGNSVGYALNSPRLRHSTLLVDSPYQLARLQMLFSSPASVHVGLSAPAVSIATSSTGSLWITSLSGLFFTYLVDFTLSRLHDFHFVQCASWIKCTL